MQGGRRGADVLRWGGGGECGEADGARTRCDVGEVRGVGLGTDVLRWG